MTFDAAHSFPSWGLRIGTSNELAFHQDDDPNFYKNFYVTTNIYAQWEPETIGDMNIEGLTLRLDVKNLFDRSYVDRATSGTDSNSATAYNEPGRTFLLTAKWISDLTRTHLFTARRARPKGDPRIVRGRRPFRAFERSTQCGDKGRESWAQKLNE